MNIYACPKCGSPAVNVSQLDKGPADCEVCKWKGTSDQLLIQKGEDEQVKKQMDALFIDIAKWLKPQYPEMMKILTRHGVIDPNWEQKHLIHAVTLFGKAITKGVLEGITSVMRSKELTEVVRYKNVS